MPLVDANKSLSDPQKIARLYYVVEPLLTKPIRFRAKAKKCQALLDNATPLTQDMRIVGALKSYRYLNHAVFQRLKSFKNYEVIFITSESRDPNMGYVYTSIFMEHSGLGEKILEVENKQYAEFGPSNKQIIYIPVAPIIFPAATTYKNNEVILKFPFDGVFQEVNSKLKGRAVTNVSLERRLHQDEEGQKGIYQFKSLLFEPGIAKEIFLDDLIGGSTDQKLINEKKRYLEDCTYVNRTLVGNAFANICQVLGITSAPLYAEKGSYATQIFEAGGINIMDFGKIIRKPQSNTAKFGASSKSSINILESYINHVRYGKNTQQPSIPKTTQEVLHYG